MATKGKQSFGRSLGMIDESLLDARHRWFFNLQLFSMKLHYWIKVKVARLQQKRGRTFVFIF